VNFIDASVTFVNADTNVPFGRIAVGAGACAVGVVPERGEAFVVNSVAGTVNRIDVEGVRVIEELRVGDAPVGLTIAPAHDRVYVSNRGAGTLSVLGVADGVEWTQIPVGDGPGGVTVDPVDGRLLVADAGSGTLTIVEDLLAGRPPAPAREEPSPLLGKRLPEFSLVDHDTGEKRSSHEWAEKRYIVNFFASW
jgi:YVTN family beta-propeller protein